MHSRKRFALIAPLAAVAVAASACGSSGSSSTNAGSAPSGAATNGGSGSSSAPSASGAASSAAPAATTPEDKVTDGGDIVYGADQEPTGFNTNTSKDNGTAAQNIIEGVLPSASYGNPALTFQFNKNLFVEDPKVISSSPETIEYKIKPEAKWSDGEPIDVTDFKLLWTAQNGKDTKFDVAGTTGYEDIKSVEAKAGDKKDIIVTFAKNYPDWQGLFGNILPAHLLNKQKDIHEAWNNGLNKTTLVSGGPYQIATYKTGDSLTLTKNPAWYGPAAHLDKIVFRFLPESTTQPQALQNKEVNLIYPQPQLDLLAQVKNIPAVKSELNFGLSFEHIDFNAKTPGLDDVEVRKAIALALDRTSLIKRTVGQFSDKATALGNRIWLNGQPAYEDHSGDYGKGNADAANKALDAAGYVKGADGTRAKGAVKLAFKFTTTQGNALRQTTFDLFSAQMKAVGISITPDIRPSKVVFPDLAAHKFQIALFAWVGTPFPVTSNKSIYVTGGGQNYGFLDNKNVNKLFDDAFAELDTTKSAAIANEIDKELWNSMVTIPLYQKPTFIAYDEKYGNVHDNSTSDGPFFNSYTWGVKAQ